MKNVLLVTQGFPYGVSEQGFLPAEYSRLSECFRLSVLAFDTLSDPAFKLSDNVRHYRYTWSKAVSPLGALKQLQYKEVRSDIALLARSPNKKLLPNLIKILFYSRRAEQLTAQLSQIIENDKIDIVYTYWCVQATLAAIRLKRRFPSLKVVTRMHGMDLYEEQLPHGWQPLRPFIAKGIDRLVFICKEGMDYFMSHWGREWAAKSEIIHVGCRSMPRCAVRADADEPLALVSCSSVIAIKRVELIADALAALNEKFSVNWHHIGDGELGKALEAHAADTLGRLANVSYTLHGAVPNKDLPHVYSDTGAQLFINVSETEGLPVSIMEAFAMGIPAVATAVGGVPEMVMDGKSGFLLPPNPTPAEVADALTRYASMTYDERAAMSQAAFELWAKHYSAEENANRLVKLLDELSQGEQKQ